VIEHPLLQLVFILANVVIACGYGFVAAKILPKIQVTLLRTKIGGVAFLTLCGATHLDMAYHTLFAHDMTFAEMATSWHMLAIHVPQAVAVWLFVTGLYIEVGSWAIPRHPNDPANPASDDADASS
jgi:hypothetical protein